MFTATWVSLIPPLLIIILVLITRKVILSFLSGIISALLILVDYQNVNSVQSFFVELFKSLFNGVKTFFFTIFEKDGYLGIFNGWNVSILFFLFALGILTSLMILSGSTRTLTNYALKHIKSKRMALLLSTFLGIFIFIDDYFNALVVGNISKPITTKHKITRAKLAYIVDSTSAPICVIAFISSWGAGIVGQMKKTIEINNLPFNALNTFFNAIPFQFYVFCALSLVFITIFFNINLGDMHRYEEILEKTNVDSSAVHTEFNNSIDINNQATIIDVIIPLGSLFLGTIFAMFLTNFETDKALRIGGVIAIIGSLIPIIKYYIKGKIAGKKILAGISHGIKSMLTANMILIFAWVTSILVNELGTAGFLSGVIQKTNLNSNFIPIIVFLFAAFMAFATGTSWGTFGILIPLVGSVIAAVNPALFVPAVAATLSGAVFGDHASPISDTTVLSSAGSGCDHGAHFSSQLPYALLSAVFSGIGFIVFGIFSIFTTQLVSLLVSYITIIILFVLFIIYYKNFYHKSKQLKEV